MTTTTTRATSTDATPRWSAPQVLVGITAVSLALQLVMEWLVVTLQPARLPDLVPNLVAVAVGSLVGLAVTWGLVTLGRRDRIRTPMAWVLAALGLVTSAVFYFLAVPATLAAGAYVLARSGSGSLRAARVVAIVGIVAAFAVSVAMLYTYL